MKRKVLVLSPEKTVYEKIKTDLAQYKSNLYTCVWSDNTESIPDSDICLIDEDLIGERAADYLAQFAFNLSPRPIIFLTEAIRSEEDYKAVKSLSSDYLLKSNIGPSSLHNAIIYGLDSANLRLEIENQQRRYESLFHGAVDPAFFLTSDWKVETVNEAFRKLFGLADDTDVRDFHFRDFFYNKPDFEELQNNLAESKNSKLDVEYRFKKPDESGRYLGHLKIAALRDTVFHEGAHREVVRGFHGTLSNISYRQKLIDIRQRAERVSMTFRLARTLAHEIRNPLTNVGLAVEQLREEIGENESYEMYLGIIERCSKRINKLLTQLLHSSERSDFNPKEVNLEDLVKGVAKAAADRAKLKGIALISEFEIENCMYNCDAEQLEMAISNLLTNALESIDHDQGKINLGLYEEDDYYCIYIEDNGVGMDQSQQEKLFDPFYTSKKDGVGLGLTATQTIISKHEGQIEVETEPGMGSTFTISLPFQQKREESSVDLAN